MFTTRSVAPPETVEPLRSAAVHPDVHGKDCQAAEDDRRAGEIRRSADVHDKVRRAAEDRRAAELYRNEDVHAKTGEPPRTVEPLNSVTVRTSMTRTLEPR